MATITAWGLHSFSSFDFMRSLPVRDKYKIMMEYKHKDIWKKFMQRYSIRFSLKVLVLEQLNWRTQHLRCLIRSLKSRKVEVNADTEAAASRRSTQPATIAAAQIKHDVPLISTKFLQYTTQSELRTLRGWYWITCQWDLAGSEICLRLEADLAVSSLHSRQPKATGEKRTWNGNKHSAYPKSSCQYNYDVV